MAAGDELLIADGNASHRGGMQKLFTDAGYICSTAATAAEVRDLVSRKFYPAILVDVDIDRPGAGLDLVRSLRESQKESAVFLLTGRRSFEAAIEAFRLGAVDVVPKQSDQVAYLKAAVDLACERRHAASGGGNVILGEARTVLDEAFRIMLEMGRKLYADASVGAGWVNRPRMLIVDGDQAFLKELANVIQDKEWEVAAEMNGGAALDKAGGNPFDIVACREDLMDLRGSMVIKTIQSQQIDALGLVYGGQGDEAHLDVYREGRVQDTERPFRGAAQLVKRLERTVAEIGATHRDRRIIGAFRSAHADFFRRYAELKLRLDRLLS